MLRDLLAMSANGAQAPSDKQQDEVLLGGKNARPGEGEGTRSVDLGRMSLSGCTGPG